MIGLASCDDKSDLGIMQTNPQLPAYSAEGMQLSPSAALTSGVNLNTNTAATINVLTIESPVNNLPDGAYMAFDMELSPDADFSKSVTMTVIDGAVSAQSWEEACLTWYGEDPTTQTMYVRFAAYVVDGTQLNRIGDFDTWYLTEPVQVTPVDAGYDIEEEYYLVFGNNSLPFQHSDSHPYVDPVFTLEVELSDADVPMDWILRSVSGRTYGVSAGTTPDTLSGTLEENGVAAVINTPGSYIWNVNILDLSYTITTVSSVENLWTPGSANGWDVASSQKLFTENYVNYIGFAYLDSEFKFTNQPDWNGTNYGAGEEEGTLSTSGGNLTVPTAGLYYCNVDLPQLTYALTEITSVSLIGGFNDWSGDVELNASDDFLVWQGTLTLTEASEWKFRMNNDWGINLGGNVQNLQFNGDNIYSEAGTYQVILYLNELPYSCTVISE